MDPLILLFVGVTVIVGCILILKLHPVLALLFAAIIVGVFTGENNLVQFAQIKGMSAAETLDLVNQPVGQRIAAAFGNTASKIGILIAMAAIIGTCLLRSGAADKIIRAALKLFGEKGAPVAFLTSGFTLAIPVFFDTVFYLLVPLSKAMTLRSGKNYLFYITAVVAGGAMAHSLVPPTPGPLFVAAEMGVDMGVMMVGGLVVGMFTITGGYLYAAWANRKWTIPLRDSSDVTISELEDLMNKEDRHLPALWLSLMPIILPILLISGNTITKAILSEGLLFSLFSFFGNPNIALTLAAVVALGTLAWNERDRTKLKQYIVESLKGAGMIILITSMGGAFGGTLQQTGIGARIQELASVYHIAILPLAFFVTVLMRTAQGSATVAMITSVGILGGFASMGDLAFHPVYLALVIGCGSKPIPWMNDSGFWVVCTMSGMTETETLKTFSSVLTIMGFIGLFVIIILAKLFPLI
ncbi:MAG TPA: GntP family permease [Bacteroides sp.]|nr:GntP family permease [Bacteroides sp.]